MLLCEFASDLSAELVALTNQLKQDVDDGMVDAENYTVDQLLDYFQQYDVILDVEDLYNMIKVPPLKDVISNIQGDQVVFVGHDEENTDMHSDEEENHKTVSDMAKKALKRN